MAGLRGHGQQLIELTGDRELIRKFEELTNKVANRVARKALNKGSREMRDEIKYQIRPARTKGHSSRGLKANIGSRLKKSRRTNQMEAVAGVGVGKKQTGRAAAKRKLFAPHFHLVALGSKSRFTGPSRRRKRNGVKFSGTKRAYRGRMPADNFVPRAYSARGARAVDDMLTVMRTDILKAATEN